MISKGWNTTAAAAAVVYACFASFPPVVVM
jgi:hypothetical protein